VLSTWPAPAWLYELRLVRPGLTVIEQSLVGAARETARRLAPLLTPERCRRLDGLLEVDADSATAEATWLRHFPVAATPGVMHDETDKLVYLRELGAENWDLGALPGDPPGPLGPGGVKPGPGPVERLPSWRLFRLSASGDYGILGPLRRR